MDGRAPPLAVILLFIFIFLSRAPQTPSLLLELEAEAPLESDRRDLAVLNGSQSGDFAPLAGKWLNLTGFRREDGYAWDSLHLVRQQARSQAERVLSAGLAGRFGRRYEDVSSLDREGGINANWTYGGGPVPFYQNVSGSYAGTWVKSRAQTSRPALNLSEIAPDVRYTASDFDRNVTGHEGPLLIKLEEKTDEVEGIFDESARPISADITLRDRENILGFKVHGVHYPKSGAVLLTTTSKKYAGVFALPHLVRTSSVYELTRRLLNQTMSNVLDQQESSPLASPGDQWLPRPNNGIESLFLRPECEFLVYLQQSVRLTDLGLQSPGAFSSLEQLERELRFPTGALLGKTPEIEMLATIFSPDCGFLLESKGPPGHSSPNENHLRGQKLEVRLQRKQFATEVYASILLLQLWLLIRQMKDASTPSTRSRISFYTIIMMGMADAFIFLCFFALSKESGALALILLVASSVSFISSAFFGMNLLSEIWNVQAGERRTEAPVRPAANTGPTASAEQPSENAPSQETSGATPADRETLPLPVTAPRARDDGAVPIVILPPDQEIEAAAEEDQAQAAATTNPTQTTVGTAQRELGALWLRFWFLVMVIVWLSLSATTWPYTPRSVYCNLLAFLYLSFWVPQIKRNVVRNCRKALRWEYVIGQSVLRLVPFMYFYTVADNVFFIETDPTAALILAGWVWLQFLLLLSQEILGPRFFVPGGWAPPAYDYYPVLREDDEESTGMLPLGFTEATIVPSSPTDTKDGDQAKKQGRVFDCAICMQDIDVSVGSGSGGEKDRNTALGIGLLRRRRYMVTPCRHIFHGVCLEGWMKYRLQCPICRETLPPL